jgi:hypothetical protein
MENHKIVSPSLKIGLLWGLVELTLGAAMHEVHIPYAGMMLFAVGASILLAGCFFYHPQNPLLFCLAAGIVASGAKALDVFLPSVWMNFTYLIRPMMFIVGESLLIGLVYLAILHGKTALKNENCERPSGL